MRAGRSSRSELILGSELRQKIIHLARLVKQVLAPLNLPGNAATANNSRLRLAGSIGIGGNWQNWYKTTPRGLVLLATALMIAALLPLLFFWWIGRPAPVTRLQQAQMLYSQGSYTQAASLLRTEIKDNPTSLEPKQWLAQTAIALRQWTPAYSYLNQWLAARPNDPLAYYWLGKAQAGDNHLAEAETTWNLIISLPTAEAQAIKPRVQVALGNLKYNQGQLAAASSLFYAALASNRLEDALDRQQAFYLYGVLLARDLRFEDAIDALTKAAQVELAAPQLQNPTAIIRRNNLEERARTLVASLPLATQEKAEGAKRARLAYALLLAEEYTGAEEQLLKVLQIAPTYADARAYLGVIYWRTGRYEQAQTALNQALAQSPGSRLTRQAWLEFMVDRLTNQPTNPELIARLNLVITSLTAEFPTDAALQVIVARFYFVTRDYQQAQQSYLKALEFQKTKPIAGLNPGAVLARYYSDNSFDPCVRGVDTALQATRDLPNDPESWLAAGTAFSNCGHFAKAATMLEKALELQPYRTDAVYRLALGYDILQRVPDADRLFNLLADIDPARTYHRPHQAG